MLGRTVLKELTIFEKGTLINTITYHIRQQYTYHIRKDHFNQHYHR